MTTGTARNRAELTAIIDSLGDVAPGSRRVFRGQSKAYTDDAGHPLLLPAVVRPKGTKTYDPAWLVSVQMYLGQKASSDFDVTGDLQHLWAPALLQHYGPGSSYLDVTANLDIALWFSFYKLNTRTVAVPMGELSRNVECAWHTELPQPWPEGPEADGPTIYVLDSPVWNGKGVPKHGESVDLLAAGAGILPEEAARLHRQTASLVYVDIESPSLEASLRAVIRLAPDFDRSTVSIWGRATHEIFPPPTEDPFYRRLLDIPAQPLVESPKAFRNPLSIPCYVSSPDAGGEVAEYAAFGPPIHPPLCHHFLLTNEAAEPGGPVAITTDAGERLYHFKDATPFLLEAPLWIVLPGIKTPKDAGDWIPSALPLGIAPEIAGRPTDSVYVELSGLDPYYPTRTGRDESMETFVRGIWLVRAAPRYICTVYAVTEGELFSYRTEYIFFNSRGVFGRVPWPREDDVKDKESFQSLFNMAQKSIFVTLLLLKDLSPGFKPPSTFSITAEDAEGNVKERFLGSLLDPQLGEAKEVAGSPYLIPKALNGTAYVRASGAPADSAEDWRKAPGGFEALAEAFVHVRDPRYLMEAGVDLAEWYRGKGERRHALHVLDVAIASARSIEEESEFAGKVEAALARLQRRILRE